MLAPPFGTSARRRQPTQVPVGLLCLLPSSSPTRTGDGGWGGWGGVLAKWRANHPPLLESPKRWRAARLMSADYSVIGVLQNKMTSALFTDGINHSLAELEIPAESLLHYAVFGGGAYASE